ncbi:MAG: hypothetical protein K2J63_01800 [Muribaculaceae bacterium]|nr:hypothetical protein [Muribaculaceae bacterium]
MKKQLITSVGVKYIHNSSELPEMLVIGEVFHMRRTRILKRLVRKILHKIEIPIDFYTVEEAKEKARREINKFVYNYYQTA